MLRLVLALSLALLIATPAAAASVDGIEIHSTVTGSGPKTIVFVHGWTCDETSWAAQVPAFAGAYRVITLDLPGHGKTGAPAPDGFSMDLFARAVEAVRAEAGADKIVLVGHSMGAVVIREYALDYPQHVAGLVAVDGPLDLRPFKDFSLPAGPLTLEARTGMIQGMFVPTTAPELRERILAMMLAAPDATMTGAGAAMFDPKLQSDRQIAAPALTVWAGTSNFAPGTATRELYPNWTSEQFAGTGHFVMMEQPVYFNAVLQTFLEQRAQF